MKVRANARYRYDPKVMDIIDPPYGVRAGTLKPGDIVTVVKLHGCPPPNTMGMCHINGSDGHFAGLVCTGSLHHCKEKT